MIRTAFLDRDGTLNVKAPEGSYVTSPDAVVLLPGAGSAVRRLNEAGVRVVLVTNQRGLARGLLTPAGYAAVADRLRALLAADGARLDASYMCPHEAGCDCRKPRPGLLLRAMADDPGISPGGAVLVGDAESDVAAGIAAGVRTVRLGPPGTATAAGLLRADLAGAVDELLAGGLPPGHVTPAAAAAPAAPAAHAAPAGAAAPAGERR
ncbi:MAG TPA: HAD-IIIA family hydrolase [Mycobacteriales bacterium]|nr:HAD-IIIA family hydrolase [Mycobacteriales bacterium]